VLPLLQLGYDIDTDLTNTVRANLPYRLVLRPGYQPGATGPGRFTVDLAVSYDDGAHWLGAETHGDREVTATVPAAPAGAEFATIRVSARDRDGNRIEQTITRAWRSPASRNGGSGVGEPDVRGRAHDGPAPDRSTAEARCRRIGGARHLAQ
jgi:hypothetical protein